MTPHTSEIVKHLRTVHFTLFIACLVILGTNIIDNPDDIFTAYGDIKFIREIQDNWDPELIQKIVSNVVNKHMEENPNDKQLPFKNRKVAAFKIDRKSVSIRFLSENRPWTLREKASTYHSFLRIPTYSLEYGLDELIEKGYEKRHSFSSFSDGKYIKKDQKIILKQPVTLKDIIAFWNDFSPPKYIYVPQKIGKQARLDIHDLKSKPYKNRIQIVELKEDITEDKYINVMLHLMPKDQESDLGTINDKISFESAKDKVEFNEFKMWIESEKMVTHQFFLHRMKGVSTDNGFSILEHYYYRIPVYTLNIPFNLHQELMRKYNYARVWRTGKFRDVFPELNAATENVQDLKIEDVEKVIYNEKKRTGGYFEILGAKLPRSALSKWGMIIIISIQVYFWLHLKTFHARTKVQDHSWGFPWIALYPDRCSQGIFVISILLLPVFTVWTLSSESISKIVNEPFNIANYLNLFLFVISISLSILLVSSWFKIIRKAKPSKMELL